MNLNSVGRLSRRVGTGIALATLLGAVAPALGAANGLPHLDPTGNNGGTAYTISMNGSSASMDPVLTGGSFAWRGTLIVHQDTGVSDFDADLELDTSGDGTADRFLRCSGVVGSNRIGMRCSDNDDLGELRMNISGRVVVTDSGATSIRKAGSRGYTDTYTFLSNFQALEVAP